MYDDIINGITYQIALGDVFLKSVFEYSAYFSVPFSIILGIMIGAKFLKSAFDL